MDPPSVTPEASDDLNFNFDALDEPDQADAQPLHDPAAPYELSFDEGFDGSDDFKGLLTEHARASGLEAGAASKYINGVIGAIKQAEKEQIKESGEALRTEWGAEWQSKMKAVRQFAGKLQAKAGLSLEDMAPLQSPKGFKLLHALMQNVGESVYAGGKAEAAPIDAQAEANRMLTDPSHPQHAAMMDPLHPQHAAANSRYNDLVGITAINK